MPTVFVSYRRGETTAVVHRLAERLRIAFGDAAVYLDVDSLPPGRDFRTHLQTALSHCDAAVVVIGRDWLGATESTRRIDDANDFVRLEVELLLERDIPVVPVLVDRTPMPAATDLPNSICSLAYRQAEPLDTGPDFHFHAERLARKLSGGPAMNSSSNRWLLPAFVGFLLGSAIGGAAIWVLSKPRETSGATTSGEASPAIVGNNNSTVVNPPDPTVPKTIDRVKEAVEKQTAEIQAAERRNEIDRQKLTEERRKLDEDRKKWDEDRAIDLERRYREGIREDIESIRKVTKLQAQDLEELQRLIEIMIANGSDRGAGRGYAAMGQIQKTNKKYREARTAFEKAASYYKAIDDRHMQRWIAEQIAELPKE